VLALIFELVTYMALGEKYHLLSTFKVLFEMHNQSDRSHTLPMVVESASGSSAISGCVKICRKVEECIGLTSALSHKEVIDSVQLVLSL